jgi:hypothetical protein
MERDPFNSGDTPHFPCYATVRMERKTYKLTLYEILKGKFRYVLQCGYENWGMKRENKYGYNETVVVTCKYDILQIIAFSDI